MLRVLTVNLWGDDAKVIKFFRDGMIPSENMRGVFQLELIAFWQTMHCKGIEKTQPST